MTSVFVIASSALIQAGLESLIAANAGLAPAADERQADVIVVELDGRDAAHAFAALALDPGADAPAVVVLGPEPHAPWLLDALRSNVRAILARSASAAAIVSAIEAAAAGLVVIQRETLDALAPIAAGIQRSAAAAPSETILTRREVEVLRMLAEGVGNKTIAAALAISEHTVKFHVASIFSKLGASSRTEAVTLGARHGLILL